MINLQVEIQQQIFNTTNNFPNPLPVPFSHSNDLPSTKYQSQALHLGVSV
jgi:hypothetical protein